MVSTLPLVPQVVDAVSIPVIAAGGIGDARGFVAAFALGAVGVQMGTRFMATAESDLNSWGRVQLQSMRETDTIVTRAMTGATVRCVATPEIKAYEQGLKDGVPDAEINDLKRAVRSSRNPANRDERQQSAMGQIGGMIDDEPSVEELIDALLRDAAEIAESLRGYAKQAKSRATAA